jgi:Cys-rich repeat protein
MASQGSLLLFPLALLAASCSGNVVGKGVGAGMGGAGGATTTATGGGATSTTGSGSWTSTGTMCSSLPPGAQGGGCHVDADCNGGTCGPIAPGGYRVCLAVEPEATSCTSPSAGQNACCTSADCAQGKCYSTASLPYCGGPPKEIDNQCFSDQCTTDAECVFGADLPPQLCAPAGFDGSPVRVCFTAYCHTDADCTAQPCGACVPIVGPCCDFPVGLGCVYPGGCARNADCPSGNVCELDPITGTGTCTTQVPICPV